MAEGGFDIRLGSFADGYLTRKIALKHGFCYAPRVVATWCVSRESVSRKTAVAIDKAHSILETVTKQIASDPARRWRFAALRLALEDGAPDPSLVELMVCELQRIARPSPLSSGCPDDACGGSSRSHGSGTACAPTTSAIYSAPR